MRVTPLFDKTGGKGARVIPGAEHPGLFRTRQGVSGVDIDEVGIGELQPEADYSGRVPDRKGPHVLWRHVRHGCGQGNGRAIQESAAAVTAVACFQSRKAQVVSGKL
jgi:hypothetical protein